MRIVSTALLIFCLAGCNRGVQNNDAVRQGVLDYLSQKAGMNVAAMEITLTSVKINGNQADATVSFAAKGATTAQMTMQYHLEQKDNKWAVVGRQDSSQHTTSAPAATGGDNPHGAGTAPGGANPHAGGMPAAGGGKMPAPEDLPPAGKKK